jgi:hypothetical protein
VGHPVHLSAPPAAFAGTWFNLAVGTDRIGHSLVPISLGARPLRGAAQPVPHSRTQGPTRRFEDRGDCQPLSNIRWRDDGCGPAGCSGLLVGLHVNMPDSQTRPIVYADGISANKKRRVRGVDFQTKLSLKGATSTSNLFDP